MSIPSDSATNLVAPASAPGAPLAVPVILKPRPTNHNNDTPTERSSATAMKLRDYLSAVFGEVTTVITGDDDEMLGAECMHGIPRSFPEDNPLHFAAFRDDVGHRITKKDGTTARGFNLETCRNLENGSPDAHRQFDGRYRPGTGLYSYLPHDPPLEEVACEIGKRDGRSLEEMYPGVVFEYEIMPWDGRELSFKVSNEPFRTASPPSHIVVPDDLDDSEGSAPPQASDDGIVIIPMASVSKRPGFRLPGPNRRTYRIVVFPNKKHIVRSIFHPVIMCHDIMVKLRYRLPYYDKWTPEMVEIWTILQPNTQHWFPEAPSTRLLRIQPSKDAYEEQGDNATKERKAKTVPTVPKAASKSSKSVVTARARGAKPLATDTDTAAPSTRLVRSNIPRIDTTKPQPSTSRLRLTSLRSASRAGTSTSQQAKSTAQPKTAASGPSTTRARPAGKVTAGTNIHKAVIRK